MNWDDPANVARLEELWAEGHSTAEIGRQMGVTKNVIIGKANRLRLPSRPSPIRRRDPSKPKAPPAPMTLRARPPMPARVPPPLPLVSVRPQGFHGHCVWPMGMPRTPTFHFCGHPALCGRPYCPEHCEVAYVRKSVQADAA